MSGTEGKRESESDSKAGRFSLHNLSAAFARLAGASDAQSSTQATDPSAATDASEISDALQDSSAATGSDALSPRMIVEGMLFVGNSDGGPLTSRQMAGHIRDVSPPEVESLINELNDEYAATNAPYRISGEGSGFRFELAPQFEVVRQRLHGRVREAKLTPTAIEVLAVVAYRQPISAEAVSKLRGGRSHTLLNQLVRRGLLCLQRPESSPRKPNYATTDRFNALFRIGSPQDLPSSEDLDDC